MSRSERLLFIFLLQRIFWIRHERGFRLPESSPLRFIHVTYTAASNAFVYLPENNLVDAVFLFFLSAVHSLPHLTVLSLSGCSKITDDGVELIAENLQKLRALDLSWCPRITDAALEYIACDLNMLEELTLDRFEGELAIALSLRSSKAHHARFLVLDAFTSPTSASATSPR